MGKHTQRKDEPMAVRLRLGDILKERKMTQTKFAEISGLSRNTVSSLVHQPAQIRFDTIDTICDTLGIRMDELFERVRIEPY
jgi:DNA-binding Xre family transcriptional regulator